MVLLMTTSQIVQMEILVVHAQIDGRAIVDVQGHRAERENGVHGHSACKVNRVRCVVLVQSVVSYYHGIKKFNSKKRWKKQQRRSKCIIELR